MKDIAHVSDLHFGAEQKEVVEGLILDLARVTPSLLVVRGDLTQRARRKEFIDARHFLDRIPCPRLVVPGNHDIPPCSAFRRWVTTASAKPPLLGEAKAWPRAMAETTAEASAKPGLGPRGSVGSGSENAGCTPRGRSLGHHEGLARRTPLGGNARARLRAAEVPRARPTTDRGRGD